MDDKNKRLEKMRNENEFPKKKKIRLEKTINNFISR